ncbi:MAG TPA: hypothetical protein VGI16_11425 [Candidatus Acidoferrum sp.]|jgi:hypothetical protein
MAKVAKQLFFTEELVAELLKVKSTGRRRLFDFIKDDDCILYGHNADLEVKPIRNGRWLSFAYYGETENNRDARLETFTRRVGNSDAKSIAKLIDSIFQEVDKRYGPRYEKLASTQSAIEKACKQFLINQANRVRGNFSQMTVAESRRFAKWLGVDLSFLKARKVAA